MAPGRSVQEIRDYLEVDSLHYLSVEGMLSAVNMPKEKYCTACFTGDYPVDVDHPVDNDALERRQLRMFK